MKFGLCTSAAAFLSAASTALSFYLPGVGPKSYALNEPIELFVNHLTPSMHHMTSFTEGDQTGNTIFSYDYYYHKFKFCQPANGPRKQLESLGAIISGDRIFNSPFEIKMLEQAECKVLCVSEYEEAQTLFVNRNIRAGYTYNWIVDGLPAARHVRERSTSSDFYSPGFPIGYVDLQNNPHLYDHFVIHIEYHKRKDNEYRVVGVVVDAQSIDREGLDPKKEKVCNPALPEVTLDKSTKKKVMYTYSVVFTESATVWATRWDKYLHVYDPKIQWVSLINFTLIVVVLAVVMSHILYSTLKSDITKYNEINLDDDVAFESGWKLVSGDVFRSPGNRMLLSILVGSGVQLFSMALITIVFALFGLLSPSNRGALTTFMFVFYMILSFQASYVSGYLYRFFGGENWKLNMVLTPVLVPSILFGAFLVLNFFLISKNSSGALPFGTMIFMIIIWFSISMPLGIAGSVFQSKRSMLSVPVRTNQIPRQIPPQPWYVRTVPVSLTCGLFPFGSIAVELYFIYSSIWFNRIFYMFGFLFLCFVLMVATTALVSVLAIYYSLCAENYRWHWKAMFVGGGCSFYVFLHALFFLRREALSEFTSVILFAGYSTIISALVFLVCGSLGFLASLFFARGIYSQIKID